MPAGRMTLETSPKPWRCHSSANTASKCWRTAGRCKKQLRPAPGSGKSTRTILVVLSISSNLSPLPSVYMSMTNAAMTLSLADSMILASAHTADGPKLYATRERVRSAALERANKIGRSVEIYACKRHGGHVVDVVAHD
jgi:hypothetical protein